jgi:hypothetical protein
MLWRQRSGGRRALSPAENLPGVPHAKGVHGTPCRFVLDVCSGALLRTGDRAAGLDDRLTSWHSSFGVGLPPHLDEASPRGAAIEAKGFLPRAVRNGFFTVARPAGGGWGSCDQMKDRL